MIHGPQSERGIARCRNCGAVLTVSVLDDGDGDVVPVGVARDGKCGDGDFEVVTGELKAGIEAEA